VTKHERDVLFGFLKSIGFLGQNFIEKIVRNQFFFKLVCRSDSGGPRYIIVIVYSVIYTGIFIFQ